MSQMVDHQACIEYTRSEHATLVGFLTVNAESDKNPTNYHG